MIFFFTRFNRFLFSIVLIILLFINTKAQTGFDMVQHVQRILDLYTFNARLLPDNSALIVGGYYDFGDGGGGMFMWSASSTEQDDSGIIIKPNSVFNKGRFVRINSGQPVNVQWFGAIPNGSRIVTTSIQGALNKTGHVVIPYSPYAYLIDDHLIVKSNTWLDVDALDTIYETSGNNVVLLRNVHVDTTGITDHDIIITGGIWDGNWAGNPGTSNFSKYLQLMSDKIKPVRGASGNLGFYGVRNLKIKNVTVRNAVSFGIQVSRALDFNIENIHFEKTFETVSDGLHINGPSSNFTISNITGKTGDDFIALNAWDWLVSSPTAGGTGGDIKNGIISNIRPDTCKWAIVKSHLGSTAGLYDVTINDIKGVSLCSGICIVSTIDQQNPEHTTGLGTVQNLILNKISASIINSLVYDGIEYGPVVSLNANVKNLTIRDAAIDGTFKQPPGQPFLWQHANSTITNLEVSGLIQSGVRSWNNVFDFNGTVKQFTLSHSSFNGSGIFSGDQLNKTIRFLKGSAVAFADITDNKFSGVAGALENLSSIQTRVIVSNNLFENFYNALEMKAPAKIIISNNFFKTNGNSILAQSSGDISVLSQGNDTDETGATILKLGGTLRWNGTDLKLDAGLLHPQVYDLVNNNNSRNAVLGIVYYTSSKWHSVAILPH